MADIQHKDIPEAQLHEPKGVSTAASGKVYVANGSGSGIWEKLKDDSIDTELSSQGSFLESNGVGVATFVKRIYRYTVDVGVLSSVAANTTAEQTVTVTGLIASTDDVIQIIKPTLQAGLFVTLGKIVSDNQLVLQFANITASPITPTASETYKVYVWRR